ncbi:MAG: alpha-amylase family glycosyl hydrolase [Eubacterium sp.]|nr:alpha-amylase family glycosyl hydrolase [Eubacterium sp.]
MWAEESVFYQFYPLGMTGAPYENDGILEHRILKVLDWIPHLVKLGVTAVYFSPLFESDTHGYNTRDYRKIDTRLGTNEDFVRVVKSMHEAGIRVILDGVFNHAGRGFWAFQDVKEKKWDSPYKDWFFLNFDGNSSYNDGFWYEGWEGNYDLVKLNLKNPAVADYLMGSVKQWIDEFDIDGLRLDVAYMVDRDFLKRLRYETSNWKPDFFLAGEILGGDYKTIMNHEMCHSATNYECYKGMHSALNSHNLFEIVHSLLRQFGSDPWCLYTGQHLISFVDNHDVSRIASILNDPRHLPIIYTLMFGMPGIPMIYYGSEWGIKGDKKDGDPTLRPAIDQPQWNELTDHIAKLASVWKKCPALQYGDFKSLVLTNNQCVFQRSLNQDPGTSDRALVALNISDREYRAYFDAHAAKAVDLVTGLEVSFEGGLLLPPYTGMILKPLT